MRCERSPWEQVECDWYYCCITKHKLNSNYEQSFISIIYNGSLDSTIITEMWFPHIWSLLRWPLNREQFSVRLGRQVCLNYYGVGSVPSLIQDQLRLTFDWHQTSHWLFVVMPSHWYSLCLDLYQWLGGLVSKYCRILSNYYLILTDGRENIWNRKRFIFSKNMSIS